MSASVLIRLFPCLLLMSGCGRTHDEERRLDEMAADLFSGADGKEIVIAFSSAMEDDRYRFVLNALNHRLGRPATIFTDEENVRLLRALSYREAIRLVVLPDGMIRRIEALRNPLVAVRRPGTTDEYDVLPLLPPGDFRNEFIRIIQAEGWGGDIRTF